jgi:hypothetical protein
MERQKSESTLKVLLSCLPGLECLSFFSQIMIGFLIIGFCFYQLQDAAMSAELRAYYQSLLTFIIGFFFPNPKLKINNNR